MTHKILIVDDEPNIVMSLEFLLKKEGFQIDTAGDGDAAIEKVRSFGPDLVLLDVMMPKNRVLKSARCFAPTYRWPASRSSCSPPRGAIPNKPKAWRSVRMPICLNLFPPRIWWPRSAKCWPDY